MGDEIFVRVRVRPGMRKERMTEINSREFTIDVKEDAERNEANDRVAKMIALHYEVPVKNVKMISGFKSGAKRFTVIV